MKTPPPQNIQISRRQRPREILFFWGNKFYFPNIHVMFLLYRIAYDYAKHVELSWSTFKRQIKNHIASWMILCVIFFLFSYKFKSQIVNHNEILYSQRVIDRSYYLHDSTCFLDTLIDFCDINAKYTRCASLYHERVLTLKGSC